MIPRARFVLLSLLAALVLSAVGGPVVGEWVVRTRVVPKLEARIGRTISVGSVWVRWGKVELRSIIVDGAGAAPPVVLPRVRATLAMGPLFSGRVEIAEALVDQPRIEIVKGAAGDDNISSILDKLRAPKESAGGEPKASSSRLHIGKIRVVGGAMAVAYQGVGEAQVAGIDAELSLDGAGEAVLRDASLHLAAGPRASATRLVVKVDLAKGRLDGLPTIEVVGGSAAPFRGLALTGITGTVQPDPGDPARANLELHGSYGGADTELWNARGFIKPAEKEGELKLRAARFKLSQLESIFQGGEVVNAKNAEVDAHFEVSYAGDLVKFGGAFHLAGLTVAHPMLAPVAVPRLGFDAHAKGTIDVKARKVHLAEAGLDFRNVHALLAADVENLGPKPRFSATLKVKPLPCQVALAALPSELTPNLQGFKLSGTFSTDLHMGVDFGDLDEPIDLGGLVGIEGCKVIEAPDAVDAEKRLLGTFEQTVQLEPGKWQTFFAGPENPEWVPYADISPHLINSIMTTEDNGFFRHRGFIPSEFRSALQQNLQKGYFRLGASSITMQMVKNVLLSREKTLSRKLQELFLTWYLEHHLTKERILEIYFNVIEFGPGIYGIGRAARHYFGKPAKELEPREAAFFSSILPSPKRRYVQYCHATGTVDAKWDAYLKRIIRKNHERNRLTDEEYDKAVAEPLKFDRAEAMPERECMAMVKRITTPLVPPGATAAK
jgi:hypothetical protein